MNEQLFQQFLIILTVSLFGAILFRRLRMATIVAYIVAGALIGPSGLGLTGDPERFSLLAEFGVVFLLFSLGLEFNFKKMLAMRFVVFGVGSVQVLICTLVFCAAVYIWGASLPAAIIIAGSLALSSTAIVTRELQNNRQLHHVPGQISIGILLFQDLAAVVFLILVPVLAGDPETSLGAALLQATLKTGLLLLILLAAGKWLLPVVFKESAISGSDEILVLTTLVIVLLASWLTHSFGLSMALGGFVTGMMLGEGSYKYQIESDIRPFRDILLGLFFVTIGMNLDLSLLLDFWLRILLFAAILLVFKTLVVSLGIRLMGYARRDALSAGFNLSQAGEFGLALISLAMINGVLTQQQGSFTIIVAICTMIASPALIRNADWFSGRIFRRSDEASAHNAIHLNLQDHVIIGGYGRLGSTLAGFLDRNGVAYIAIDTDIDLVERHRKKGTNIVYGDSNSVEILKHCNLAAARLVVLTFKSIEQGKAAISGIRQRNPDVPIIVRCQQQDGYEELVSLGASHVFPELLESSLLISRQVLELVDVSTPDIDSQIAAFRQAGSQG